MNSIRQWEASLPDLRFQVEDVLATPNAAAPQLTFKVRVTNSEPEPIHSIALRVQVQIEPVRRRYTSAEQEQLTELFGGPEQWSKSLQPLLWANVNVNVAGFSGSSVIDVPVPCTFDFNIAVTKYIHGLENGELPTSLLFSGTVFYPGRVGLQIAQIPWDREASYRVPVKVWKEMMNFYYPDTAWLCVRREAFEWLYEYRARHGLQSWEQALERLLGVTAGVKS
jgi:Family of unknown function (DUF6084)